MSAPLGPTIFHLQFRSAGLIGNNLSTVRDNAIAPGPRREIGIIQPVILPFARYVLDSLKNSSRLFTVQLRRKRTGNWNFYIFRNEIYVFQDIYVLDCLKNFSPFIYCTNCGGRWIIGKEWKNNKSSFFYIL